MKRLSTIVAYAIVCMTSSAFAQRTLEHETIIDAPTAEVWAAWTTNEGFTSWAVAKAEIDLRIGGDMRTSYNPQSTLDDEHTIINRIISYEPQRMLSIKNVQASRNFKNAELFADTWSVIYFNPLEDGRTHIRIIGIGYGEGPEWDDLYAKFKAGNQWTLDKLKEKFAGDQSTERDDAADVMDILRSIVGGDWIYEDKKPDGSVFRARSRMEFGPEERSIHGKAWLGDANGMSLHGNIQIWREPAREQGGTVGAVRFQNINESGSVARGEIHWLAPNQLEWDWNATDLDGTVTRFHITTTLLDADHYQFRLTLANEHGDPGQELVNIVYTRVQDVPAAFMKMTNQH